MPEINVRAEVVVESPGSKQQRFAASHVFPEDMVAAGDGNTISRAVEDVLEALRVMAERHRTDLEHT